MNFSLSKRSGFASYLRIIIHIYIGRESLFGWLLLQVDVAYLLLAEFSFPFFC